MVCVESGYELHIGGNGGIKIRVTDLLCKVATEAEVLEYIGAYMQIYREEARYLERTAHWIDRVGLSYVKSRIVDGAAGRKAAHERFLIRSGSHKFDPWAERVAGRENAAEFKPAKELQEV